MNDYSNYSISHYGHIINCKDSLKFLSVIIYQHLSWLDHINRLVSKLSHDIALLNTTSKLFPKPVLLSLYYAFFHSHLIYGIEIWCGANMSIKKHLRLLQKRAIRIVCCAPFLAHTEPIAKDLKILLLNDLTSFAQCVFKFKVYHTIYPNIITSLFCKVSLVSLFYKTKCFKFLC